MISRPLGRHKVIDFRLTEAEAQLAMSQVREVVLDNPTPTGFVSGLKGESYPQITWQTEYVKAQKFAPPAVPKFLGKALTAANYQLHKTKAEALKDKTWPVPGSGMLCWGTTYVTVQQWLNNFDQFEQAWFELQGMGSEKPAEPVQIPEPNEPPF